MKSHDVIGIVEKMARSNNNISYNLRLYNEQFSSRGSVKDDSCNIQ